MNDKEKKEETNPTKEPPKGNTKSTGTVSEPPIMPDDPHEPPPED